MSDSATDKKADGRLQRSANSRQRIQEAAFALCEQGVLVPTAQEIADASGVGLRTVFRHFSDMESLFTEMDKILLERFDHLLNYEIDDKAEFEARLDGLIEIRVKQWEQFGPFLRMTLAQKWRYAILEKNYARQMNLVRKDMVRWLPELAKLPPELLLAAEAVTSFEAWNRLRTLNGQSEKQATAVVRAALLALLDK